MSYVHIPTVNGGLGNIDTKSLVPIFLFAAVGWIIYKGFTQESQKISKMSGKQIAKRDMVLGAEGMVASIFGK
jgi:hypothetical protein